MPLTGRCTHTHTHTHIHTYVYDAELSLDIHKLSLEICKYVNIQGKSKENIGNRWYYLSIVIDYQDLIAFFFWSPGLVIGLCLNDSLCPMCILIRAFDYDIPMFFVSLILPVVHEHRQEPIGSRQFLLMFRLEGGGQALPVLLSCYRTGDRRERRSHSGQQTSAHRAAPTASWTMNRDARVDPFVYPSGRSISSHTHKRNTRMLSRSALPRRRRRSVLSNGYPNVLCQLSRCGFKWKSWIFAPTHCNVSTDSSNWPSG